MTFETARPTPFVENPPTSPKVAVVGCGRWGKNLIRNFHGLEFLHSICDLNLEALKSLRQTYPDLAMTPDYDQLVNNPAIDGVVIATPASTHFALAKKALEKGKHVYVEKPIATNSQETQELFRLSEASGKTLMVGHLLMYHPVVARLKQLIQEGHLGEVKYIQSDRLNFNPFRQDKSVIWDLAPHDLSMLCHLLDTEPEGVVSVSGHRTGDDGRVDVAHIELRFPGGVAGHINNSWIHPSKQVKLVVRGTERTALLDDTLETGKLQIFSREDDNTPIQEFPEYLTIEPLKLECQHFINCIRDGKSANSDGYNGYTIVKVLELAERMIPEESETER